MKTPWMGEFTSPKRMDLIWMELKKIDPRQCI